MAVSAYYAIKYKVPIYSYHRLARSNNDEVVRMRNDYYLESVGMRLDD